MSGDRIINMGSGNYNESVQGDSINIQGNYIITNQDFSQVAAHIQQRLTQLQNERQFSKEAAQKLVATELANQAKNQPAFKQQLTTLGKYIQNGVANGLIGQAAVEVV